MIVDGYIVNINVMCTVNIRGHKANFYEAEARCHEAEARKSEAEWFGLEATWGRGINIPGALPTVLLCYLSQCIATWHWTYWKSDVGIIRHT